MLHCITQKEAYTNAIEEWTQRSTCIGSAKEEAIRVKPDKKGTRQEARNRQHTIAGLIEIYINEA